MLNEEGELFIGGVGVFAGYLERDDLTSKAVIYIDDMLFYRTGDLAKIDHNGRIYYQGRKDFQIKLHGQRIELGEIERCLLSITSISTCVVVKWGEDHLVAYVQSSVVSEKELHEYCQSHLPPHMIPSYFIILDKLPLNPNGKIDRKRLPSPDSLVLSSTKLNNTNDLVEPTNKIESIIHHIWCDLLKQKQISTNTNIFSIGGHSLIIMQLLHHYKVEFRLEINSIAITDLFQHPTIIDHAKLIHQILNTELSKDDHSWHSLNILTAKASFAQERIFLDENIRFSSSSSSSSSTDNNTNMYVIPLIYRLSSINDHHISISRLYHAYQCIIRKHQILRTALYLDQNGIIVQDCRDMNTLSNNSETFGHVINCHILRSHTHSSNEEDDMLNRDDLILFTVHHAFFDGASTSIFIRDLSLAYQDHSSLSLDDNSFQYVDYSVHEHVMDMTLSREFWYSQLQGCDLQHSLSLPYDRSRSSIHHRSGLGATTQIILNDVTCTSFLNYASSHHLTFFQLGLSIFYVFLFKLSHNQTDLCVGSINANRYRSELYNMIGMFVATLPYRIQLNGDWSFDEVFHSVREMCLSILKHSHYPLQHILNDFHANQSNLTFLETMFDFITLSESESSLSMNDTKLEEVSLEQSDEIAKFDFMLTFVYNPTLQNNRLSLYFICSHDLFDDGTVTDIGERFSYCIEQLFVSNGIVDEVNMCGTAVSKLDLILPKEAKEIDDVIFDRQSNITSEAPASYAQARIWLGEQMRFDLDQPQVAIYNMPFIYHLSTNNTISVKQLQHALYLTIDKHFALHTAFIFDTNKNILMQRIIDVTTDQKTLFTFIESTYETQEQLNNIIHEEKRNPRLFSLNQGLVFRCHLVYYKHISSDHLLHHKDIIIFNFHHAAFDFPSTDIFLHDLNQAYTTSQLLNDNNDETNLRYLDYAAIEQQMPMTGAEMFWLDALHNSKLDQSLSLPYDRYRLANEHRTGRGTSISFDLGQDLSHYFLTYASTNNISLEYLSLMTYFIFLFKLTNGEQDLCIGMNTDGRYRDEFRSLIGMFVNAIPLRCQLDPHSSFHQFTQQMRVLMTNSMKYSYFPLQRILAQHPHLSNPAFLDTSFQFITSMTNDDQDKVNLGDNELILAPYSIEISEDEVMSKFDFILTFHHTLDPNELSCTIDASLDLFHVETVNKISQQFHSLLYDLCASIIDSQSKKPLYELSLTLPTEQLLVQSMNNTQISYPSVKCIHHEFVSKAMIYSQKLAVELDEQSLTYCELLYYVQVLSLTLLNEYRVNVGDIICQCVERSISMVIGIMGILMAGGVYCPLSPRDPEDRLHALVQQTMSHVVIVHQPTVAKISDLQNLLDIDILLTDTDFSGDIESQKLSKITVSSDNIAYIIFTSGSTGVPKAIQTRHRNFSNFIRSLQHSGILLKNDVMAQICAPTYDVHTMEIIGSLFLSSSLVLLHPYGNMDFLYFMNICETKKITCIAPVPTFLDYLCDAIERLHCDSLSTLRSLCFGGEPISKRLVHRLQSHIDNNCTLYNIYAPAETTVVSFYHRISSRSSESIIALGRLLPNEHYKVLDMYFQHVPVGQQGELFIGGGGVFAGYLYRNDLTTKVILEIDEQKFYQTGDVVKLDRNGLVYYEGRKDFQIKLHGQRIELGEIERCLLSITSISTCVVVKWGEDHLVAYVQSSVISENELHEYCQSHLPPHMIPSRFIILDKLPLNPNGKIDRKRLPSPDSLVLSSTKLNNTNDLVEPTNKIESIIHHIWCDLLKQKQISTNTNIFSIGGHSLIIMQLLHHYKVEFRLEINSIAITDLFQHPTIIDHAKLIHQILNTELSKDDHSWHSLNILTAKASFAQERIFLDENIRFSSSSSSSSSTDNNTNMYVIPLIYRLSSINDHHISISRLYHAYQCIIRKHQILRTALYLDQNGIIVQDCRDMNTLSNNSETFGFSIVNVSREDGDMNEIVKRILNKCDLFDLSKGHVINCHILRSHTHSSNEEDDMLNRDDLILFTVHHAFFDGASTSIFIRDLSLAYQDHSSLSLDDNSFQYVDYSVHEHVMDMTLSREFWYSQLQGCDLQHSLSLPYDRSRSSIHHRSGLGATTQIILNDVTCTSFLNYASSHHLTFFNLDYRYFIINANRYRSELYNMIGMFVATLPYRIQLNGDWSFDEVVHSVREMCLSILKHSHYPLQHILNDFHANQSNLTFLETMFDFITLSESESSLSMNDTKLEEVSLEQSDEIAKFDFMLTFVYNPTLQNNRLSLYFICSHDLFDDGTVTDIGERFSYCIEQLFVSNGIVDEVNMCGTAVSKLDLILPKEAKEIDDVIFDRQSNITSEGRFLSCCD
ncbi:hypothetical protein I4U23_010870 [Adineta vaga]|nr:hypothetical protein I4U23_010870 [Adineta vaga]